MTEPALYARMELRLKDFERQLQRAEQRGEQGAARIGKSADKAARQLESRLSSMSGRLSTALVSAFAGVITVQAGRELIDTSTRITNSLKVAGLQGERLEAVYHQLFSAAQENAAPIESMVELYSRLSLTQKELGATSEDLISFTGNIALALRVAGTDASQASGALTQLAQALGGGVVRAEEFNSLVEGTPTIVRAAAAGIAETAGSVAKLRQLVVDGKVSSEAFFRGFQAGSVILEQQAAGSVATVSQEFTRLSNTLVDIARQFDKNTEASRLAGQGFGALTAEVRKFGEDIDGFVSEMKTVVGWITSMGDAAQATAQYLREMLGLGRDPWLMIGGNGQGGALSITIPRPAQKNGGRAGAGRRGGATMAPPVAPDAISLADYEVDADGKKGKRSRADSYQRLTQLIQERTSAIEAETAAQAGLNPLVNDYGFAVEKARAAHDLLTAAQQAGIAVTPELEAKIDTLATAYANASVASAQLAESQGRLQEAVREVNDMGRDALGGFITDLRNGVSAADALSNALDRVIDRLLDSALDSLFAPSSGGGLLGAIFGSLAGARARGGPMTPGRSYLVGEKGPEVVTPRFGADVVANRDISKMSRGGAGGGVTISMPISIDATGADAAGLARVERKLADLRREVPGMAVRVVQDARRRNVNV